MSTSVKNRNYVLKTKKYHEKICENLRILGAKKAIEYDFISNPETNTIEIQNIETEQALPKDLVEVILHLLLHDVMSGYQKKKKMTESEYLVFAGSVFSNNDIGMNSHYMLIEVNEWLLTDSFYNLDTFIDFRLNKYKSFFAETIEEIYKEEQIIKENMERAKELEDYMRDVFEKNFGLEDFQRIYVTLDEEGQLLYKTEGGIELTIPFIQEVLGVILQFYNGEEPENVEMVNRGKILQLLITSLGVEELDITDIVENLPELAMVSNIFSTLCRALGRNPIFINRNADKDE